MISLNLYKENLEQIARNSKEIAYNNNTTQFKQNTAFLSKTQQKQKKNYVNKLFNMREEKEEKQQFIVYSSQ